MLFLLLLLLSFALSLVPDRIALLSCTVSLAVWPPWRRLWLECVVLLACLGGARPLLVCVYVRAHTLQLWLSPAHSFVSTNHVLVLVLAMADQD